MKKLTVPPHFSCFKEVESRYFALFQPGTKLPLNYRKPENNSVLKQTDKNEITTNHKGTRMVKDGED